MTLSARDRRALLLLGIAVVVILAVRLATGGGETPDVVKPVVPAGEASEKRLIELRTAAAALPAREETLKQALAELATREKGLLQAQTASQAQAQLLQVLRKLARAQAPPVEIRNVELGAPQAMGADYGEVTVSVALEGRIDQLLNLLAELTAQPELIATREIRAGTASGKDKLIPMRLTVSGVAPRRLIPEKKGPAF